MGYIDEIILMLMLFLGVLFYIKYILDGKERVKESIEVHLNKLKDYSLIADTVEEMSRLAGVARAMVVSVNNTGNDPKFGEAYMLRILFGSGDKVGEVKKIYDSAGVDEYLVRRVKDAALSGMIRLRLKDIADGTFRVAYEKYGIVETNMFFLMGDSRRIIYCTVQSPEDGFYDRTKPLMEAYQRKLKELFKRKYK